MESCGKPGCTCPPGKCTCGKQGGDCCSKSKESCGDSKCPMIAKCPLFKGKGKCGPESCVCAPRIQKPAPRFEGMALVDGEFRKISSDQYRGKYLVLFFYPLDFTFVCPTEILAYSDATPEFQKQGCNIVACSVDSEYSHFAYTESPRNKGGLGKVNFPMLSDITKQIARDYGCLIESGEESGLALRYPL